MEISLMKSYLMTIFIINIKEKKRKEGLSDCSERPSFYWGNSQGELL
jgi:hypothetical protein